MKFLLYILFLGSYLNFALAANSKISMEVPSNLMPQIRLLSEKYIIQTPGLEGVDLFDAQKIEDFQRENLDISLCRNDQNCKNIIEICEPKTPKICHKLTVKEGTNRTNSLKFLKFIEGIFFSQNAK
jgi:hypothetical protein